MAKYFPAAVKPVVQWCLDHDINMIQMPCPEFLCAAGGPGREPHGKIWYERKGLRETSRPIGEAQADYAKKLVDSGCTIVAVFGMEFSPACAVNYLNKGQWVYKDQGIYIEEFRAALVRLGLNPPFIGVNQRALKKLSRDLDSLLNAPPAGLDGPH